ncbi:MAG: flagellar biosynthesis repressor FlbT [Rhizobiaceae bacterium]|nr:flagellar biosynthesis repressor FlbT [Rhizobiaceae bacterium]
MSQTLRITLKANEKIYVNGAVIRADRKVSLELLNDVQFLLETHVLQPEDARTPVKQLYFIVQVMLMNPGNCEEARNLFRQTLPSLLDTFSDPHILSTLKHVDQLVGEDRPYEALKAIRGLFTLEHEILNPGAERAPIALVAGE